MKLNLLKTKILTIPRAQDTMLIAIDGVGGSGKSTLAKKLQKILPNAQIVELDDFYSHEKEEAERSRLLQQVIVPLTNNKPARYQKYDWDKKQLGDWEEILPGGIVILEGTSTLHTDFYDAYDFSIWIECDPEHGFQRGLKRDKEEYGVDTFHEWQKIWLPKQKAYIEEHNPHLKADYIFSISESSDNPRKLNLVRLGHPALRKKSHKVTKRTIASKRFQTFLDNLAQVCLTNDGAGIAAPQVGVNKRVIVVHVDPTNPRYPERKAFPLTIIINPKVIRRSQQKKEDWEGDLSADIRGLVPRADQCVVHGLDRFGNPVQYELRDDFHARVFQHEIDHLDGIFFIDRVKRKETLCETKEWEKYWKPKSSE